MEIEQVYPAQQLVPFGGNAAQQGVDLRRGVQDRSSYNCSVAGVVEWLEANYHYLQQICYSEQNALRQESQEQVMVRIIKEQLNGAHQNFRMNLNFNQLDVQPALMEKVILSINQLENLKSIKINLSRQNWGHEQVQVLCNQLNHCHSLSALDIDFALNCVQDRGVEVLQETLSNLQMLESINLNFERNGLQRRSISLLEIFNKLKQIQQFSLNLDGNRIEIEDEMKVLLPKFNSENIFANVHKFEIRFNEYLPKNSGSNAAHQDSSVNNGISGANQIHGQQIQDHSNYNNLMARSQHQQINQSNNRQLDQSNQSFYQSAAQSNNSNSSQLSAQQQQQLQLLQQNIAVQQQQLQQLHQYAQQMLQRGFPQNHPQYIQVATQMQQLQVNLQQNVQMSKTLASKATAMKKKSVISRLLEIMLKFTHNLQEFTLACPGQLMDSACWEYFAELVKIKGDKLKKFHFAGLNSNTKNQELEYFFYQMAKLTNLQDFSLSLHNLSAQSCLHLDRFLKSLTKLEKVHIDLSSPDSFSNQGEIFKDLCNFMNNTQSASSIKSLDLNISNSLVDADLAVILFQGIAKMRNLSSLKINMQSCKNICDKSITYLCQALLYQKNIKQLHIDAAQSNFSPISVQNIMQTLILLKDNLLSLQLNLTNRGEGFINFNNNLINDAVSQLTNLKKCVISSARNPKIGVYREKAQDVNRLIKLCQLMKKNEVLKHFRKEVAYEVLQQFI